MVKILPEFSILNISDREQEILSCLSQGQSSSARQIAKTIGLSEQKVYPYLKNLLQRGFLTSTGTHPTSYLLGSARVFQTALEQHKAEVEQTEDFLKQLAEEQRIRSRQENPFYQVATTLEWNERLQLKAFGLAQKEFLQILNIHHDPASNRSQKLHFERAIVAMLDRGVSFKTIYPKGKELPTILKNNLQRFEVRRLDTTFQRCDIIDERYVLLKIIDERDILNFIGALFIDDKKLARNLKNTFFLLWEKASMN